MASVLGAFNSSRILMTRPELPLFPFNGSFVIFPKKKMRESTTQNSRKAAFGRQWGERVCISVQVGTTTMKRKNNRRKQTDENNT
jgi:hypothetical protein